MMPMPWKYEKWKDWDVNIEQIGGRKFKAWFDPHCPGCITQILVSSCRDRFCKIATAQSTGYAGVTFTVPEEVNEFYVAGDLQYSMEDAIRNYPNNIVLRVYWEEERPKTKIPPLLVAIPLIGGVIYFLVERLLKKK